MTERDSRQFEKFTLPDGRAITCTNEFNTAGVWQEFSDGLYARSVAVLRPGDTIVDVGAHVGLTALLLAGTQPGIRVVACEPAPPTYACLADNFFRLLPKGVPVNTAIGASAGTAELTYYPQSEVMTTLHVDEADDRRNMEAALRNAGVDDASRRESFFTASRSGARRFEVPVITLSQLIEERRIEEIGLLKIDVERAELDVLRGLQERHWPLVRSVVAEVHDVEGRLDEFQGMLRDHGFRIDDTQQEMYSGASTHMVTANRV
ncbi:FkbM family methyltransferase [Streptomyces sp. NPDC093094]|uniref:FkbM family methyltransferase n=1 Tax=Streptomyces sp. NPDC093094 TaxID=3366026 RepID=UPI003820E39B